MSRQLIDRSPDLKRLRDEGFHLVIADGHLVLHDVPYVNSGCQVRRGSLVSSLTTSGNVAAPPGDHVARFAGDYPCDSSGRPIESIRHESRAVELAPGLTIEHSFSAKPHGLQNYPDFYEKMTAYVAILEGPAQVLDAGATAKTWPVHTTADDDGVFHYHDTASSRAGIATVTAKLEVGKVAIVGLGGTGSYVLDLIAKTPIQELHLFDGDEFLSHNAFRAPGAASVGDLEARPKKVDYYSALYGRMRRGIVPHPYPINRGRLPELGEMEFVFLCIDPGDAKRAIVEYLEAQSKAFVDVGMGVELIGASLSGLLRTTLSTPTKRDHLRRRVSLDDSGALDDYSSNIQVADLNALNAALAVIKWKKTCGFYLDLGREHSLMFSVDDGALINEDSA